MPKALDYLKKRQEERDAERAQGGLRMSDLADQWISITGIEVIGESKFLDPRTEKPKPSILAKVDYADGAELVSGLLWINGVLAEDIMEWFDAPDAEPIEGILEKLPLGNGGASRWTISDPDEIAERAKQKAATARLSRSASAVTQGPTSVRRSAQ